MEEQRDIQRQHRQEASKYTYFLITLSVTAIAFSVQKTLDEPLLLRQIPLGLAVLSWAISVLLGFVYLQRRQDILATNNAYFEAIKGNLLETGNDQAKIQASAKIIWEILEEKSEKASKFYIWQFRLFILGIVLFVIWHLIEMAERSKVL